MKESATFHGRSLLFNWIFVALNVTGLVFMVIGGHESFAESSTLFNLIGLMLMITSIGGLIVFKGRMMMSSVSRVVVGGLFIVSGLVKANDPVGFAYKLEEYFEDGALAFRIKEWFGAPGFSMEFLMNYALILSIIICIAEIVLGVLTLIGGKIKLVSYLMLLMMVFFTFLTWHTSSCDPDKKFKDRDTYAANDPIGLMKVEDAKTNKEIKVFSKNAESIVIDEMKQPQCVDDCGCFGDALKGSVGRSLTPKESLWKDIILLYLVIWIFVAQWIIRPNNRKQNLWYLVAGMGVVIFFSWVFGWYFPTLFALIALVGSLWLLRVGGKLFGNYYGVALFVTLLCTALVMYVMTYDPLKDYRPYAVGSDLKEKMNDGVEGKFVYHYFLTDLKTGKKKRTTMDALPKDAFTNKERWKPVYDTSECIIKPRNPSIMDFHPSISVSDLSASEKALPFVKRVLDKSQVKLLKILALEYNSEMEIPFEEYDPEGFPAEEYQILDTISGMDPNLSDIDIMEALITGKRQLFLFRESLKKPTGQ